MPSCVMRWCSNYPQSASKADGVTYHSFPSKESIREKWITIIRRQRSDPDWSPSRHSRVCSQHFEENAKYLTAKGIAKLISTAIPVLKMTRLDARSVPLKAPASFPWQDPDSSDPEDTNEEVPLVSRLEQCRFCGDFSKTCLNVTHNKPYVSNNRTEFTWNGVCINLDFSHDHLPKTICRDCDVKLQEIADFVNVVKAAQDSLINVTDDDGNQDKTTSKDEDEEENTVVIKIERESPKLEQVNVNEVDDTSKTEDTKLEDTTNFSNKRKVDIKPKKARVSKRKCKTEVSLDNEDSNDEKLVIVEETVELGSTRIQKKPKVNKDGTNEIYIEIDVKKEIIENADVCDTGESEVRDKKQLT